MSWYLAPVGGVSSVNGHAGAVTLVPADLGAPSTTGTGATGTWGISINGNAATVTSITSGQVITALGYIPVNKAGDSGIGSLAVSSLVVGNPSYNNTNSSPLIIGGPILLQNMSGADGPLTIAFKSGNLYTSPSMAVGVNVVGGALTGFIFRNPAGSVVASVGLNGELSALSGSFSAPVTPGTYTVATLPAGTAAMMAYASNGRKAGESAGAGTGVLAIYTNAAWRDPSQAYAVVVA